LVEVETTDLWEVPAGLPFYAMDRRNVTGGFVYLLVPTHDASDLAVLAEHYFPWSTSARRLYTDVEAAINRAKMNLALEGLPPSARWTFGLAWKGCEPLRQD